MTKPKQAEVQFVAPAFAEVEMSRLIPPKLPARFTMSDAEMVNLTESLRAIGLINPLSVRKSKGRLEIISGHRRYLAALSLKWSKIRVCIYPETYAGTMAVRFHENSIREALNPAEEALWMRQAQDELQLDEAGLCQLFRVSADHVAGRFALLRGDVEVFNALQRGEIRVGVAHELNRITDDSMRRYYLDIARKSDPSRHVVHGWVEDWRLRSRAPAVVPLQPDEAPAANAEGQNGTDGAPPPGATAADMRTTPEDPIIACVLCGGHRDPYNLVNVFIHRHELDQILKSIERAAKGLSGEG